MIGKSQGIDAEIPSLLEEGVSLVRRRRPRDEPCGIRCGVPGDQTSMCCLGRAGQLARGRSFSLDPSLPASKQTRWRLGSQGSVAQSLQ